MKIYELELLNQNNKYTNILKRSHVDTFNNTYNRINSQLFQQDFE